MSGGTLTLVRAQIMFLCFQVADSLDNLLEDLSSLNRSIVNADPIPASPDKLKDDLEENKVSTFENKFYNNLNFREL